MPPDNVKGRPTGQQGGPEDASSADITTLRITRPIAAAADTTAAWHISDLPEAIAAQVTVDPVTGEWIWTGRLDRDGYGRIGLRGAHREVYELLATEIAPGLELDHVRAWGCTSRACVSPWHLEPVTRAENIRRGDSFAGINARKTRCDNGHEYTDANTYRWHGRRDCRACIRSRVASYKQRQRTSGEPLQLALIDLDWAA